MSLLLQSGVQVGDAGAAAIHRREDLNVGRLQAEFVGDARRHQIHDQFGGLVGILFDEEEKIIGFLRRERHLPAIDAVRVGDDVRLHGLPEDHVQPDDGGALGGDDVAQHVARAHAGQLIDIADEQQVRVEGHGFQQVIHQQQIDHAGFVDDEQIDFQRILRVALEAFAAARYSSSRWIVLAGRSVAWLRRLAARPVGEASA